LAFEISLLCFWTISIKMKEEVRDDGVCDDKLCWLAVLAAVFH
jgi:hypothetical protein